MIRLAAILPLIAGAAQAQMVFPAFTCDARPSVLEQLGRKHDEDVVTRGVAGPLLIEWFASPGGTWTILVTDVHGKTCVITAGTHFEWFEPKGAPS